MAYDGSIVIDTKVDGSGAQKGISGIKQSITKMASALGVVKVVSTSVQTLKNSVQSAFNRIDVMEQFDRTMTAITKDSSAAGKALDKLRAITKGTAYGLDVAAKATQDFVTRGMEIGDATKRVEIWSDAVAFYGKGTNEQLSEVMDALAKMSTKGKVEMDQLNRLFDAGIDAVGMYAKATGRASADVQSDLTSGKISTEEFLTVVDKAMRTGVGGVKKIAGAAKEAGASWQGSMDNMKAAVTRGMVSIIDAIDDGLKSLNLPTIRQAISNIGAEAEKSLGVVSSKIKKAFSEFGPAILSGISGIKKSFSGILTPIQSIVNSIKLFIADIVKSFQNGGLQEAIKEIGNTFTVFANIASKVAKVVLPILSNMLDAIGKHSKTLIPIILSLTAAIKGWQMFKIAQKWLGAFSATLQAVSTKITNFTGVTEGLPSILNKLSNATKNASTAFTTAGKTAQAAGGQLSIVQKITNGLSKGIGGLVSPTGLAITAILGVTAATVGLGIAYYNNLSTPAKKAREELEKTNETLGQNRAAMAAAVEQTNLNLNANYSEISSIQSLWNELTTLVDANGNVKKGYEERVDFIINQLNSALGIELSRNGEIIQGYKDTAKEIDNLIAKKRAEMDLEAHQGELKAAREAYSNAIKAQAEAMQKIKETQEKVNAAQAEYNELRKAAMGPGANPAATEAATEALAKLEAQKSALQSYTTAYQNAAKSVQQNSDIIHRVENANTEFAKGNYKEVGQILEQTPLMYKVAYNATVDELKNQAAQYTSALTTARENLSNHIEGVTEESVAAAEKLAAEATAEYQKAGGAAAEGYIVGFTEKGDPIYKSAKELGANAIEGIIATKPSVEKKFEEVGLNAPDVLIQALIGKSPDVLETTSLLLSKINDGVVLKEEDLKTIFTGLGIEMPAAMIQAIASQQPNVQLNTISLLSQIGDGVALKEEDLKAILINCGLQVSDSLISGISVKSPDVQAQALDLLNQIAIASDNEKEDLVRQLQDLGIDMDQSVIDGLLSKKETLLQTAEETGSQTGETLEKEVKAKSPDTSDAGLALIEGLWEGISNSKNWLWEKIGGFCSGIVGKVENAFGIHSPSRVFAELGGYMAQGLGVGFKDNIQSVNKSIQDSIAIPTLVPVGADIDFAGVDTGAIVARMQSAVAASQARVSSAIISSANANIISKLDNKLLANELREACREGCESANLTANVRGQVTADGKTLGEIVTPYVDRNLGSSVGRKSRHG